MEQNLEVKKKRRTASYYLVLFGNIVELHKVEPTKVFRCLCSTLIVPKFPMSPATTPDYYPNMGLTLKQKSYIGSELIGYCKYSQLTGIIPKPYNMRVLGIRKITLAQMKALLPIVIRVNGE
jgi:hypothetical protein